jgi:hypothetical protein
MFSTMKFADAGIYATQSNNVQETELPHSVSYAQLNCNGAGSWLKVCFRFITMSPSKLGLSSGSVAMKDVITWQVV